MASRNAVRILALSVVALCVLAAPKTALAKVKAEPAWNLDKHTYCHYRLVSQENLDEDGAAPRLEYVHFMGYEIDEQGIFAASTKPWIESELLFQLGAYLTGEVIRDGDVWDRYWDFEDVYGTQKLSVHSEWSFVGFADYDSRETLHIRGAHLLRDAREAEAPPRWTEFELTTDTYFDEQAGLLRGLKIALTAKKLEPVTDAEPAEKTCAWGAEWRLGAQTETTETDALKKKVERAIVNGVDRLWALQNKEGLWPHSKHARGGTALSLLALLMCGVDPADEKIKAAFELLPSQEMQTTYDVAVTIMAYEALYISKEEREAFLKGDKDVDAERKLNAAHLAEVQRMVDWLIANRNEPNLLWNYKRNHNDDEARYDFSITQYALLGLQAAGRCGVAVPPGYVRYFAEEVQKLQAENGREIKRVEDYKPGGKKGKRDDKVTFSRKSYEARGWAYYRRATWNKDEETSNAYGSMTCAGLTCLIAALDIGANMDAETHEEEFDNQVTYRGWQRDANDSMDDGFAWLEHRFSITRNPNKGRYWYYYYLYGLERVCMLADVRYLGTHDWYHEGAAALLALQDDKGGWGNAANTSFALLFLKKGTVPLKKPVYTGEGKD